MTWREPFTPEYRALIARHARALRAAGKPWREVARCIGVSTESARASAPGGAGLFQTVTRVGMDGSAWVVRG